MMERLAPTGSSRSNTNYSRSISFAILDQNLNEIPVKTDLNKPIQMIIPRDPNLTIPPMISQNVTNKTLYIKQIDLKQNQPNENLTISIHFQFHPSNTNLSYLFFYQFDQLSQIHRSNLFCPSSKIDFLMTINELIYV
jgi:hypothetical protein